MKRWLWFVLCAALGLSLVAAGWLVPAHLRALEKGVLALAGRRGPTLLQAGQAALEERKPGVARQLGMAARAQGLPGTDGLEAALRQFAAAHPELTLWGGADPALEYLFRGNRTNTGSESVPIVQFMVRQENRQALMGALRISSDPAVKALLACQGMTNTVLFPPSGSSAGQALDTGLVLAALLAHEQRLALPLRDALAARAREALDGGRPQLFEQTLLDLLSLGQRFDWTQLCAFAARIEDPETLRVLARLAREADSRLPVLFAAVHLSGKPPAVAGYLMEYSRSGLDDLGVGLRYGTGGLKEVLERKLRVHQGRLRSAVVRYDPFGAFYYFALDYCWLMPWFALTLKWLFYLGGGFLLAAALHFARPPATRLEQPLLVPGFSMARESLFALGFLLVMLLLSEPFLAQDSQKVDFPFRLRLPMAGAAAPAAASRASTPIMNPLSLLSLLLFFVLQALIYTACLLKLAEIRRQQVPPRMKLKLLENEEHLFDAGLYFGFVGTILSLILVSMGVIKQPSLMAAYSSTSFGIIFVSVLKIFHVRPYRRRLILETEASPA